MPIHFDGAVEAVCRFVFEFVVARQRVKESHRHQIGRPLLLLENVEVKILLALNGIGAGHTTHFHSYGDHGRFLP